MTEKASDWWPWSLFSQLYPATVGVFAFLLFVYLTLRILIGGRRRGREAPEAGGAWPLIGHLRLLGGPKPPHEALGELADKYGPIFTIRIGVHRALVVSNWELAKECFTANDIAFSNRPKAIALEHMGYNHAMFGFAPYGTYWRELRKIVTLELLSTKRLALLSHVCDSEVTGSIKGIYELWVDKNKTTSNKVSMEMKRWFGDITVNMIFRIMVRKRITEEDTLEAEKTRKALRDFFELMGVFTVADAIPWLGWLDLGGYQKAMKKTAKQLDSVLRGWLEEHKQKIISGEASGEVDFMDVMLSVVDDVARQTPSIDPDRITKSTCLSLTLAATDTTTVSLTWALALLLNNRHTLKKAQEELDMHVGRERRVKESDMKNLVYLQAVIKETLRLYPPTQLLPPREAAEDCNVGGYHVPVGTRLFVSNWKIQRDPHVWSNPEAFQPERFLTTHKDVDLRGHHFELIPFGGGRRACPGISFGLQVVQFTLASLLHAFEVETPANEPVDMTVGFGFTNLKATPLEVLLTPRLPAHLYAV